MENSPFTSALLERIRMDGPLRFPDYMAAALYDPEFGYYARGTRQVGRAGDFFTSVSVGLLFGELLARRFLREWLEMDSPEAWRIIECGAHDGRLAADVISALRKLHDKAFQTLEYVIAEPLPSLQHAQLETLRSFTQTVRFLDDVSDLSTEPLPGIAFGNELLDALPFHIVEWHDGAWLECLVGLDEEGILKFKTGKIHDPVLLAMLAPLGKDFPNGYRTEVRTCVRNFLEPLCKSLQSGLMIWIDYGFARPDYYHRDRIHGTVRTFSNHRAGENPLDTPGEIDITAHVDFTAIAETAITLDCQPTLFRNQGAWLTEIAREWLLEQEGHPQPALLRQFQTLTHPAHRGSRFHILEHAWKKPGPQAISPALLHQLGLPD
ncbi:MAG: SAM-dependent methyltransferase [Gloeobacteraceae cyanobacterium ES-bin-144]|nr:SAM-dependent methyltransferase [Verrucomicrobiales bacterium]